MTYYTLGSKERPMYNPEDDPQHCFITLEEAEEELEFLEKELPEAKLTHVWYIQGLFHAYRCGE